MSAWDKLGFSSNMQEEKANWTDEKEEVGKKEEWEEEIVAEVGMEGRVGSRDR